MQKIIWKLNIWRGKLVRLFLQAAFGFDRWHVFTLTEKKYAKDIISYCNKRYTRHSFVEIGCGLGDIVRYVKYDERYGFDAEERVLKAANFLNKITGGKKIHFSVFNFPGSALTGKYDVILMVNWIHHIEPLILKSKIEEYFNHYLNDGGVIIIDTVQDSEYKFNHDINYLTKDIKTDLKKLGDYERQRQIWLIKK